MEKRARYVSSRLWGFPPAKMAVLVGQWAGIVEEGGGGPLHAASGTADGDRARMELSYEPPYQAGWDLFVEAALNLALARVLETTDCPDEVPRASVSREMTEG